MPDFGDGSPREDYGAVDPLAPSVTNGQITPAQWAEYQRQRRRAAIMGTLATLGGTIGLGFAGQALSGAGAVGAGALPPVSGGAPWAVTPYAGTAAMSPTGAAAVGGTVGAGAGGAAAGGGAAGAAGGGAGAAAGAMGLTPRDWMALGLTVPGVVNSVTNRPDTGINTATDDPQLRALLQTMQGRLNKSEPLYDSIMAMANGLLPTQYQRGGGGTP